MKTLKVWLIFLISFLSLNVYADDNSSSPDETAEDPLYNEAKPDNGRLRKASSDYILCSHGANSLSFIFPNNSCCESYVTIKQGAHVIAYGYITNEQNTIFIPPTSGEIFIRVVTTQNKVYSGYIVL